MCIYIYIYIKTVTVCVYFISSFSTVYLHSCMNSSVFSTAIQMLGLQLHPTHSLRMKGLELSLLLDLVTFQVHYQCLWLEVSPVEAEIKLKPSLTNNYK